MQISRTDPLKIFLPGKLNKNLYWYILREILSIFLLSLCILTFLFVMSRIGKMTDLVINRGVGILDIAQLILYSSPLYFTFTLPMSFLLSTIVALGRLSADNEVLALKASGIDLKNLFVPIILLAIFVGIFGLLNTHVLIPKSGNLFRDTLFEVIKKGITVEDKEGVFNDTIPGVVIYIDKVDTQKKLLFGVLVSDDRDKEIKQMISAQKGIINLDSSTLDLVFALENGTLHRWEKEKDVYRSISFGDYTYAMNLSEILPYHRELRKRPFEMDRSELSKYLKKVDADKRYEYILEIYKKISLPLSTLAFMLLTVPLGIKRKSGGKFSGIIYSLLLFVLYYLLMALTENIGKVFNVPVPIIAFAPNIIIAIIGLYFMRHINTEEPTAMAQQIRYLWGRYFEKA